MGVVQTALFIVGTSIGAGFISGAELVRFFHGERFFLPLLLSCALFAALLYLFMRLGKEHGGYEGALSALFSKGAPYVKCALSLCALIPCAGMLAGLDALAPGLKPLPSLLGLALAAVFVRRGIKGVSLLNLVLVPCLLAFVFLYARGDKSYFYPAVPASYGGFLGGIFYAGMNAFLAAPVLLDAGKEVKRLLPSALLSALVVFVSAVLILGKIYREGAGALGAEMPFLYVMQGKKIFSVAVACSILTSLVSSLYPLYCLSERFSGRKKTAARGAILLTAFSVSRVGLGGIVGYFYPALGALGIALSVFCIFHQYLFKQHHKKVHSGGKQTEDAGGGHHKVELKHLPAVNDKIAEPRLGDDVFAHDRADPRHAHAHFQHGNKRGKRGRKHKLV